MLLAWHLALVSTSYSCIAQDSYSLKYQLLSQSAVSYITVITARCRYLELVELLRLHEKTLYEHYKQ